MARQRFSRRMIASSRGAYVYHVHKEYITQTHQQNKTIIAQLSAEIIVTPKYYVRCFGKMIRITEREAMMLGSELVIKM